MADPESNAPAADEYTNAGLFSQLRMILRALRQSPVGRALLLLVFGITLVVIATAFAQMRLNQLEQAVLRCAVAPRHPRLPVPARRVLRDRRRTAGAQCRAALAGRDAEGQTARGAGAGSAARTGCCRGVRSGWRMPGPIGVNPDQRMHEDARKLCELSADLGSGLLQASILFVSFAGVLWVLSSDVQLSHCASRLRDSGLHAVGGRCSTPAPARC